MKFANLLISCACLLLLQLEMGAARATDRGPTESLYATARGLGLDATGLDEIWRTGQPLVITKPGEAGEQTRVTYELSPDRTALSMHRITQLSPAIIEASATSPSKPQYDWEYVYSSVGRPLPRFPEPNFGLDSFTNSLFPNWGLPKE